MVQWELTRAGLAETILVVFLLLAIIFGTGRMAPKPARTWSRVLLSIGALWLLSHIIEISTNGYLIKDISNRCQLFYAVLMGSSWLLFVIQYAHYKKWLRTSLISVLCFIPAGYILVAATNQVHGLMWSSIQFNNLDPFFPVIAVMGPAGWATIIYTYALLILGGGLLFRRLANLRTVYPRQTIAVVFAACLAFAAGIFDVMDLEVAYNLPIAPTAWAFALGGSGVVLTLSTVPITKIRPIARDQVIDMMVDPVLVLDEDVRIIDANVAAQEVFDIDLTKDMRRPLALFSPEVSSYCEAYLNGSKDDLKISLNSGESAQSYELHLSLSPPGDTNPGTIICIFHDITERDRSEAALEKANLELRQASNEKDEFLARMSHELRTPLNAIIGFSELLVDGISGDVNAEQQSCLDDILNSGRHLLNLVNDIFDIRRIESGTSDLDFQPVDLSIVVKEAINNLKPQFRAKRQNISKTMPDVTPMVIADRFRTLQIIVNLLANANKYTGDGGSVGIEVTITPETCVVSVIDDGIGIPSEYHDAIFQSFTRLNPTSDLDDRGLGLGLHLSRQLVTLMHGQIWLDSEPGKGSRFSFSLPRQL